MKNFLKISNLFLVLLILTNCKTSVDKKSPKIELKNNQDNEVNKVKNKMEIRVSCGEGEILEFINDGWVIVEENSEEKICSWKSFPASKDCDMEKDKGCKVTIPDKIGEEKIYLLERK